MSQVKSLTSENGIAVMTAFLFKSLTSDNARNLQLINESDSSESRWVHKFSVG